ncbi:hypothetical protein EG329_012968 [Mollisiaceae sp. DMI_Dod_QoI]|nr:hypothetical protein EG329_012968 [Helotiales sp. DMI_Dod_QoI]
MFICWMGLQACKSLLGEPTSVSIVRSIDSPKALSVLHSAGPHPSQWLTLHAGLRLELRAVVSQREFQGIRTPNLKITGSRRRRVFWGNGKLQRFVSLLPNGDHSNEYKYASEVESSDAYL